jgi:hypothetical protein
MNRPHFLVRVAGSPLPAFLLSLCYAATVAAWWEGNVPWWLALAAIGAFIRTLSAIGQVRRYKAWVAEWNAMDAKEQPRPKDKPASRWKSVTAAVFLFLAIPMCFPHLLVSQESRTALMLLWSLASIYLFVSVVRGIRQRARNRSMAQQEAAATQVDWMLGRASSSPSRSEATRKLPEHCAGLLGS